MTKYDNIQQAVIKNERDYAIRKGRVLGKFNENFFERYKDCGLYRQVYELLIRDADPYEIIEKLIEINDEQNKRIQEIVALMPSQIMKQNNL